MGMPVEALSDPRQLQIATTLDLVPELTGGADIQLNKRIPLQQRAKAIAWSAPEILPNRTQHGKVVGRLYSARRLCLVMRWRHRETAARIWWPR
jgi:hypothetical protein